MSRRGAFPQGVAVVPDPPVEGDDAPAPLEPAVCPECLAPGELLDRFVLESTDGPVEHVHVRCTLGHRFVLPAEAHARAVDAGLRRAAARGASLLRGPRPRGGDESP